MIVKLLPTTPWHAWLPQRRSLFPIFRLKEIISRDARGKGDNEYVINPTRTQLENADMDFMIGATEKNLMMVEGESKECSERDLVKAGKRLAHGSH